MTETPAKVPALLGAVGRPAGQHAAVGAGGLHRGLRLHLRRGVMTDIGERPALLGELTDHHRADERILRRRSRNISWRWLGR